MNLEERFKVQLEKNEEENNTRLFCFLRVKEGKEMALRVHELTKEEFDNYEIFIEEDSRHKCILPVLKYKLEE